jgi:hypothetical protein
VANTVRGVMDGWMDEKLVVWKIEQIGELRIDEVFYECFDFLMGISKA